MKKYKVGVNETLQLVIGRRGDYLVELTGKGARAEVLGRLRVGRGESVAVSVEVIHQAENTTSTIFMRAAVEEQARIDLSGKIKILKEAQKSEAFLKEDILLLADNCLAEAVPNLEIEANEVKCAHAVTIGKINDEEMFYLKSRGLLQKEAEEIFVRGFLGEVRRNLRADTINK